MCLCSDVCSIVCRRSKKKSSACRRRKPLFRSLSHFIGFLWHTTFYVSFFLFCSRCHLTAYTVLLIFHRCRSKAMSNRHGWKKRRRKKTRKKTKHTLNFTTIHHQLPNNNKAMPFRMPNPKIHGVCCVCPLCSAQAANKSSSVCIFVFNPINI